ncbi:sn-glycerol-3-phosphate ABC transporter ATP-binding protein UgpC [Verrucomicrobiaceae bacterium N1E253]|uniref:sn-glycerol-3-phosphate ABC transporter ATP-binding protein UgpC n=1 Tax=Oceaniferula marina TaxID=2748318 RepID=A0A851GMF6_9BACT|nr:sn-glycerol-3-phosphate ABC transporter ATP-binding protein UgpC [Oceaniferula marina]NWK55304.1 sn-glycerol-3-phosphate ABC transporter ATP-binding protein UgpC [Oceaniferula marina]
MASVTLHHLEKTYPGEGKSKQVLAVKNIDLEIRDGEFMVLVGPSGCAKSTTLRMIAGLESITGGEVLIDGRCVNRVAPKNRDIAMVFQNYALYPHMSVYDNMAFGLKLQKLGKKEIRARVDEAAEILGLESLLQRKPKALSGGQRQRVAVGRAIVRKPKVFLFDEPLSNLDAKMRVSMRSEIIRLHERLGATMIYVTHDQTEAMTMGDRITVMHEGEIMQVDTPLNLYHRPANRFVAGFIGSPQMNFIPGEVQSRDGHLWFIEHGKGGFELELPQPRFDRVENRRVVLGIRPEDIAWSERRGIGVKIRNTEPMGAETYVHCRSEAGAEVTLRVDGDCLCEVGSSASIDLVSERIHLFDANSGQSLLAEELGSA